MSTKTQSAEKTRGKERAGKVEYPADIDLSNLQYLQRRDAVRVALAINKKNERVITPGYVSKVKTLMCLDAEVMAELLKIGGDRKKMLQDAAA